MGLNLLSWQVQGEKRSGSLRGMSRSQENEPNHLTIPVIASTLIHSHFIGQTNHLAKLNTEVGAGGNHTFPMERGGKSESLLNNNIYPRIVMRYNTCIALSTFACYLVKDQYAVILISLKKKWCHKLKRAKNKGISGNSDLAEIHVPTCPESVLYCPTSSTLVVEPERLSAMWEQTGEVSVSSSSSRLVLS